MVGTGLFFSCRPNYISTLPIMFCHCIDAEMSLEMSTPLVGCVVYAGRCSVCCARWEMSFVLCTLGDVVCVVYVGRCGLFCVCGRYRQQIEAMGCVVVGLYLGGHSSMLERHCTWHVSNVTDCFVSICFMWHMLYHRVILNVGVDDIDFWPRYR